ETSAGRTSATRTGAATDSHNQENMLSRLRGSTKPRAGENQENLPPKQSSGAATRTVLGALQNHQRSRAPSQRGTKQVRKLTANAASMEGAAAPTRLHIPPAFQIHMDEPDGACIKKPQPVAEPVKEKPSVADSPEVSNAVVRLRQPLATIDVPLAMDVSFDSPMDMSVVEGEERVADVNEVPEYAEEIHTYLREIEVKTRPKAGYMKKQPDITNSMRAILVDWLVEVGEEYKLHNETLYLAVNYIDRFLSSMSVLRGKLQLVGTAAMLLASKFEEIYPPEVAEFVYITDDTYTKKQVLRMEHLVLKVLSFDLAVPTVNQFLTQYFLQQSVTKQVESLSMSGGFRPLPEISALTLADMTSYSLEDLMPCIEDLHRMYLNAAQHAQQSVREKYKSSKYHEVSSIQAPTKLLLD
uniref:Cyclin-A2 n=1 Tax=Salarias fasciatus TaxID=181472 RepID=A0A672G998_SALFA